MLNCCVAYSLHFLMFQLDSKRRLPIPEFFGKHCTLSIRGFEVLYLISLALSEILFLESGLDTCGSNQTLSVKYQLINKFNSIMFLQRYIYIMYLQKACVSAMQNIQAYLEKENEQKKRDSERCFQSFIFSLIWIHKPPLKPATSNISKTSLNLIYTSSIPPLYLF